MRTRRTAARTRTRRAAATALAAALLSALSACGDGADDGGTQPAPTAQPDRIVVAAGSEPRTLDPAKASRRSERLVAAATQTPLLTYERRTGDDAAALRPALARELPKLSTDRLEYRFTLRPGLVYADGRLVKASDVERAIAHASRDSTDPITREVLAGITGAPSDDGQTLPGVRTDDRTGVVVIGLDAPDGRLPLVLASPATAPLPELPSDRPEVLPASTRPLRVARVADGAVELVLNPLRAKIGTVPAARTAQISVLGRPATAADLRDGAVGVGFLGADAGDAGDADDRDADDRAGEPVSATSRALWSLVLPASGAFARRGERDEVAEALDRRPLADASAPFRTSCGLLPSWVTGSVTRDDCPPVPVRDTGSALLGTTLRVAVPQASAGATPPTATATTEARTPESVAVRALQSLGATVELVPVEVPEGQVVTGRADAALVRTDPSLPHPAAYLAALAPFDELLAREIPANTERPLTGGGGRWSALERRAVARAVALPIAAELRTASVSRTVDPRSVVLHPVLGLDLAALRLR